MCMIILVILLLTTVSKRPQTAMSHVTVVAGLLLTLDHYQPQISLKLHIKYCTLDDKIVAHCELNILPGLKPQPQPSLQAGQLCKISKHANEILLCTHGYCSCVSSYVLLAAGLQ